MARRRHYQNTLGEEREAVFFTTTVLDFARIFQPERLRSLMAASLIEDCAACGSLLQAFVVMPTHIHLIASAPPRGTARDLMTRIKSGAAVRILRQMTDEEHRLLDHQRGLNQRGFWQRSYRSVALATAAEFRQKVSYIHQNPVRAGLAERAEDYRWSSARLWRDGRRDQDAGLIALRELAREYASDDELALRPWSGLVASTPRVGGGI